MRIEYTSQVKAWLGELRHHCRTAADLVDRALDRFADQGAGLGPPLAVLVDPVTDADEDFDVWYHQELQRLIRASRSVADVATLKERVLLQAEQAEVSISKLIDELERATVDRDRVKSAQVAADLAIHQRLLAGIRDHASNIGRRQKGLEDLAGRIQRDLALFRANMADIKAAYLEAQTMITIRDIEKWLSPVDPASDEPPLTPTITPPTLVELRPGRLGEHEIRMLFALREDDAIALYADLNSRSCRTWYHQALPRALAQYRDYSAGQ